ncbi:hypothetical protein HY17_10720 [Hyphomonas sp. CY54-11-8]|nr:hypothetical protein HY17_10720 [Hyphomonas sp. CY54-11-8]
MVVQVEIVFIGSTESLVPFRGDAHENDIKIVTLRP